MKRNVHFSTEGYKVEVAHVLAQIAMGVCKVHHSATRNGYVSRRPNADGTIGEAYTYAGRYGVGYVMHLPIQNVTRWYAIQYVTFSPDCLTPLVGVDVATDLMHIDSTCCYSDAINICNDCNSFPYEPIWHVGVLTDINNPYNQYNYCVFDVMSGKWDANRGMYTGCKFLTPADYRRIMKVVNRNAD